MAGIRVTGGTFRGRRVQLPRGVEVRPTSDRARQAYFNIVSARVAGSGLFVRRRRCGSVAGGWRAAPTPGTPTPQDSTERPRRSGSGAVSFKVRVVRNASGVRPQDLGHTRAIPLEIASRHAA
ncbi:MAG: RsmD family RNA methyltransferase [Rhodococcus sp. (in: high G+C Gram-positive bacteria)]